MTKSLYGLGLENQNGWIGHNGNIDALGVWNFFTEITNIVSPTHTGTLPPSE